MSNWIKIRTGLINHPKVTRMAWTLCPNDPRRMSIIIGAIVQVWAMADQHADGEALPGMSAETLDLMVGLPGFANAMGNVGWLEEAEGSLLLPNYQEHNGSTAKKRAEDQRRKQSVRSFPEKSRTDVGQVSANLRTESGQQRTDAGQMSETFWTNSGQTRTESGPDKRERREREREEEEKQEKEKPEKPEKPKQSPAAPDLPKPPKDKFSPENAELPFASEEFGLAWSSWCRHRREARKPLTSVATEAQLAKLGSLGEQRAIAAIRHSLQSGWQGIFEAGGERHGGGNHPPRASPMEKATHAAELVFSGKSTIANSIYNRLREQEEEQNGMA